MVCVVGENWSSTVQCSPLDLSLHASYFHRLNKQHSVGVELEGRASEVSTTLGYVYDITGADCTVKGTSLPILHYLSYYRAVIAIEP